MSIRINATAPVRALLSPEQLNAIVEEVRETPAEPQVWMTAEQPLTTKRLDIPSNNTKDIRRSAKKTRERTTARRQRQLAAIKDRRLRRLDKGLIAEAVHHAVCEVTKTDGLDQYLHYAFAGSSLLERIYRRRHMVQVGTLTIITNMTPPYTARLCGEGCNLDEGDFHAWIACIEGDGAIIDFSARQYRPMTHGSVFGWEREDSPSYVWFDRQHCPDWLLFEPSKDATYEYYVTRHMDFPGGKQLITLA